MTLAESAEQPSAPDPTEVIQLEDENEQRAVDAERRDISETLSQSLSEASQVTTPAESAEQPSAPDPTEVIQLKDENEERAADAERAHRWNAEPIVIRSEPSDDAVQSQPSN